MSIIDCLSTLFAPDDCLGCGREGALLCQSCAVLLPPLPGNCFGCHKKVTGASCAACLSATNLTQLSVATAYDHESKQLVAALKFNGNRSAARLIARSLADFHLPSDACITHVPATAAHIRQRGFDQSALIARELSRITGLPRITALARSGNQHQLGANRLVRQQQLAQSLRVVRGPRVNRRHIVLVDDVLTTGSSLTSCAQLLTQAGAQRVSGLVFAQA